MTLERESAQSVLKCVYVLVLKLASVRNTNIVHFFSVCILRHIVWQFPDSTYMPLLYGANK